ncbi:MAG: transposase family protein [Deltaproteobacteria bacterium]|jgi:hypothetical protein|nr:transposase family protein [Deltaproteobacteria bacterium]
MKPVFDPVTLEILKPALNPLFPAFEKIYQVEFPIYIETIEYVPEEARVDIRLTYHRKALFKCACGLEDIKVHSRVDRSWRALDIAGCKCFLHLAVPRLKCPKCGVHVFQVPWARDHSHLTRDLEKKIVAMAAYMPCSALAAHFGESEPRINHILVTAQSAGAAIPSKEEHRSRARRARSQAFAETKGMEDFSGDQGDQDAQDIQDPQDPQDLQNDLGGQDVLEAKEGREFKVKGFQGVQRLNRGQGGGDVPESQAARKGPEVQDLLYIRSFSSLQQPEQAQEAQDSQGGGEETPSRE